MKLRLALFVLLTSTLLAAQGVEITAEPSHHFVLETRDVRVFRVEVAPHASTKVHWHRHDYLFVTLGASKVENDVQGKDPVTLNLQDGEVRYTPATFAHSAKNLADTPFRNLTIEFMLPSDAKWSPDRGMNVLHGGTQDILFVKDGSRVTETDLQPGGVIPEHTHIGPHLLVAVTDLDLESTVPGKAPEHVQLKSGEVKWIASGLTHTVTNAGKKPAKMVTLEFTE